MEPVSLTIALHIQGPFQTKSSAPGEYGIDALIARDRQDRPLIPGTHLAGKLREAWAEIGIFKDRAEGVLFQEKIKAWLGEPSGDMAPPEKMHFDPRRKRLLLGDLIAKDGSWSQKNSPTRFRIRIDDARGAADEGALQAIEAPFASGEIATFKGDAQFLALDDAEATDLLRHLELGLKWIGQLGAYRTIGFGRLVGIEIVRQYPARRVSALDGEAACFDLVIHPLAPFCLAQGGPAANLFKSSDVIPGGAIKGALAQAWCTLLGKDVAKVDAELDPERRELGEYFSKIRFTHAFPSRHARRRPVMPPLSLVKVSADLYDVALCEQPGLFRTKEECKDVWRAPAFRVDWKDETDVLKQFGWPSVRSELRVRTAIDPDTRRAAEEQLFAYEMVVPEDQLWYGRVDLSGIPSAQRAAIARQLHSLLVHGLIGLGKTKVSACIKMCPGGKVQDYCGSELSAWDGEWVLTLQTAALLCGPMQLSEASGHVKLKETYKDAWKKLSGGRLELVRYFAKQSLKGGRYLHGRFQKGRDYRPFLLTEAGSVFVLKPTGGISEAQGQVEEWRTGGLPVPQWAVEQYGHNDNELWRHCPYLPENGYGEIVVNLRIHWEGKEKIQDPNLFRPITVEDWP